MWKRGGALAASSMFGGAKKHPAMIPSNLSSSLSVSHGGSGLDHVSRHLSVVQHHLETELGFCPRTASILGSTLVDSRLIILIDGARPSV